MEVTNDYDLRDFCGRMGEARWLVERKGGVGLEAMSGGHSFREFCCKRSREMRQ